MHFVANLVTSQGIVNKFIMMIKCKEMTSNFIPQELIHPHFFTSVAL